MKLTDSICGYCKKTGNLESLYPVKDIFDNQFVMGRCSDCHAYSLHPRPDSELLKKAYDDSYYGESEQKFSFPLVEKILDWFREGRARQLLPFLEEGDCVLDLGCGNGRFLSSLLKKKKITAWGIEPPGKSAERAALIPGINIKKGYLEESDFKAHSLKAVSLFHVFEHLPNPSDTLDIIDNILKKNGLLMVSFPNISSWQSKIFKGHWLHLDPPRHLFFMEPGDFTLMMMQRGYTLIHEYYGSMEQNPFGMVQSILNRFSRKREILFEQMKGNKTYLQDYPKSKLFLHKLFFLSTFPFFLLTNFIAGLAKRGATVEFTFRKEN